MVVVRELEWPLLNFFLAFPSDAHVAPVTNRLWFGLLSVSSCTEGRSLNALCMDTGYRHWRIAFVLSWGCLFLVCLYEIHPLEKLLSLSTSTWHHGKRPEWCEQVKVSQGELVMNLCLFALQLTKHKSHFGRGSFPCVIFFRNLRVRYERCHTPRHIPFPEF